LRTSRAAQGRARAAGGISVSVQLNNPLPIPAHRFFHKKSLRPRQHQPDYRPVQALRPRRPTLPLGRSRRPSNGRQGEAGNMAKWPYFRPRRHHEGNPAGKRPTGAFKRQQSLLGRMVWRGFGLGGIPDVSTPRRYRERLGLSQTPRRRLIVLTKKEPTNDSNSEPYSEQVCHSVANVHAGHRRHLHGPRQARKGSQTTATTGNDFCDGPRCRRTPNHPHNPPQLL
jgi:hypothetical protein